MRLPPGTLSAFLGLVLGLFLAQPTLAQTDAAIPPPPGEGFGLPVDCPMGEVCTIQNYIDHDPGPGWRDHTCGTLSYDGHRGIDFRVPTEIEMRRGVPVIAAADGVVLIAKDGQPDLLMQDTGPGKTREERNGNWVAIRHGDGWVTTYAHMRQGTVTVKDGEQVKRGQKLGLIGLSGNADFPHVHFAVTYRNRLLDPFTGLEPKAACGEPGQTLWSPAARAVLAYRAGGLLSAGFLGRQTTHREVMEGIENSESLPTDAPVLIFWTTSWGLQKGDRQSLTIIGPDGTVFVSNTREIEKNQATESRWIGKKRRAEPWPTGRYRGIYRLERQVGGASVTMIDITRDVEVR